MQSQYLKLSSKPWTCKGMVNSSIQMNWCCVFSSVFSFTNDIGYSGKKENRTMFKSFIRTPKSESTTNEFTLRIETSIFYRTIEISQFMGVLDWREITFFHFASIRQAHSQPEIIHLCQALFCAISSFAFRMTEMCPSTILFSIISSCIYVSLIFSLWAISLKTFNPELLAIHSKSISLCQL